MTERPHGMDRNGYVVTWWACPTCGCAVIAMADRSPLYGFSCRHCVEADRRGYEIFSIAQRKLSPRRL